MGTTMSIMTQRLYIAVSFWMFLNIAFVHSTKETPVCPFALKSFQRPEIIILEKLMHLGYKGLVKFIIPENMQGATKIVGKSIVLAARVCAAGQRVV